MDAADVGSGTYEGDAIGSVEVGAITGASAAGDGVSTLGAFVSADLVAAGGCVCSYRNVDAGECEKYGEKAEAIHFLLKKRPVADTSNIKDQMNTGLIRKERVC
jgi:hypothetical protein